MTLPAAPLPQREFGQPVEEAAGPLPQGEELDRLLAEVQRPLVFRSAGGDLPIVRRANEGRASVTDYLRRHWSGRDLTVYRAPVEARGRFHYTQAIDAFNFTATREGLEDILAALATAIEETVYVGSTDLELFFPGLCEPNDPGVAGVVADGCAPVVSSLWMGNRTVTSAHYDLSNNCALCAAGRRRFTLFAPDQIANLYPGPLEPTPGGQVISMVDFAAPDLARYPRFATAMQNALVVTLEPGDVLVYPAMWWHQVEALDDFNILLNWWWNPVPDFIDTPQITLMHAMLSLRQRPKAERNAWKAIFDHYIFGDEAEASAHLPDHALGLLGRLDANHARRLRAVLTRKLQR